MTITRADLEIPRRSGIVKDAVHMGFYYDRGAVPDASDYTALATAIGHFFASTGTSQTTRVSAYMSNTLDMTSGTPTLRFYDVPAARANLGAPVAIRQMTLGAAGSAQALPSEVAVALSYQRAYGSDIEFGTHMRPRARDRGRIYIGPLDGNAADEDGTTHRPRVWAQLRTDLVHAAQNYLSAEALAANWTWLQFSHAAWSWDAVTKVWCDDAFDTQRRRGEAATTKTVLAL